MERYICIHGHFYQPPRENPWLEEVELQNSAYPYHDWNERVTHECYAPNARSRILDGDGRILDIVNNYARISFDFGPTLSRWLQRCAPDVHADVVAADADSRRRFGGHGSALAQPYHHAILPLANARDKRTEVRWSLRAFEQQFGRPSEGMWLPEAAVDVPTLEVLAEHGVRFTVLSPYQARRVRRLGGEAWEDVGAAGVDPTMPYRARLPSGRTVDLFFYDGPASRAVAFEGLLANGERFAQRLLAVFDDRRARPQLSHIATDGETYGHHHRHGDMALAYALHHIEANGLGRLTNYGEFLSLQPPTHEVEVVGPSSWSCAHGVERWRADCGCATGTHPGWSQQWRAPLRSALDWLRDELAPRYEEAAGAFLHDPWAARDGYVEVVLARTPASVDAFLERHAVRALDRGERVRVLKLLEMQRHALLMYASCGWFFDEVSGIETVQVLRCAARALQLAEDACHARLEPGLVERLAAARSNLAAYRDGARVWERLVRPAVTDLLAVGANHAVWSLFDGAQERDGFYSYAVEQLERRVLVSGRARLALGCLRVTSDVTHESAEACYGVLHLGDHNVSGGIRQGLDDDGFQRCADTVAEAFGRADFADTIRRLDRCFEGRSYSLRQLFVDERRRVLDRILEPALAEVVAGQRHVYETNAALMRFLVDLGVPQPPPVRTSAEVVLNADLRAALAADGPDWPVIEGLLEAAGALEVPLDADGLGYTLQQAVARCAEALRGAPDDLELLQRLEATVRLARTLPFPVDLWRAQNTCFELLTGWRPRMRERAACGDPVALAWTEHLAVLSEQLQLRSGR